MVKELMEKGHEQSCVILCGFYVALFLLCFCFVFCFCHLLDLSAVSFKASHRC